MIKQEAAEQKARKYQEIGALFYELTKEAPIDEFATLFEELEAIDKQAEENKAGTFCRNCGAELIPGTSFCMNCGTAIAESIEMSPMPKADETVHTVRKNDEIADTKHMAGGVAQKNTKKEKWIIYGLIGIILLFFVGICIAKMKGNGPSGVYECYTDYGEIEFKGNKVIFEDIPLGIYTCDGNVITLTTYEGEVYTGTYYKEMDAVDLAGESFRKER